MDLEDLVGGLPSLLGVSGCRVCQVGGCKAQISLSSDSCCPFIEKDVELSVAGVRTKHLGCEGVVAGGLVALSRQQTCDGDVFVEGFPVQAAAADSNLLALLCGGMQ